MLLVAVFGVFLLLIGLTASGLVAVTSAHLASSTLGDAISRDASLVAARGSGTRARGAAPASRSAC